MPLLKQPTEEQKKIIEDSGNIVVTAKPGSGKTFTIVEKIHLISQTLLAHQGIIAISFTKKASRELELRAKSRGVPKKHSFYGTIDSFYIGQIIIPFAKHLTNTRVKIDVKTTVEDYPQFLLLKQLYTSPTEEIEKLLIASLLDGHIFLDLCGETALYILTHVPEALDYLISRYSHIFIDEYQDCGRIQHEIFTFLVDHGMVGVAVGDIDQAIYAFTNRYPRYLLSLLSRQEYTHYEITRNHRCHPSISIYSRRLLGQDIAPPDEKRVFSVIVNGDDAVIAKTIGKLLDRIKQQYDVEFQNQIAILCRNNSTAARVASNLGLPCKLSQDTELDKHNSYWARFFNDFLQSFFDPDCYSIDFAAKYFSEELEKKSYLRALHTIESLFTKSWCDLHKHIAAIISLAKMIYPEYERPDAAVLLERILSNEKELKSYAPAKPEEVNILTLHKSKGLEYDIVFHMDLAGCTSRNSGIKKEVSHQNVCETSHIQILLFGFYTKTS